MGKEEEAGIPAVEPTMDAPPPAYSESDPVPEPSDVRPATHKWEFPPAFNVYLRDNSSGLHLLGQHRDEPIYAVWTHMGLTGKNSHVVLHNGPTNMHPMIASAETTGHHAVIRLPPLPGVDAENTREVLGNRSTLFSQSWEFAIEVGDPSGPDAPHRERFEWRSSHGEELRQLDHNTHSHGWKLVRLDKPAAVPAGRHGERAAGVTSDGLEVVAISAENQSFSTSKALRFAFLGSGATGELGDRFALMTVMSALWIWHHLTGL